MLVREKSRSPHQTFVPDKLKVLVICADNASYAGNKSGPAIKYARQILVNHREQLEIPTATEDVDVFYAGLDLDSEKHNVVCGYENAVHTCNFLPQAYDIVIIEHCPIDGLDWEYVFSKLIKPGGVLLSSDYFWGSSSLGQIRNKYIKSGRMTASDLIKKQALIQKYKLKNKIIEFL